MKDDLLKGNGPVVNPLKYPTTKCEKCGCELFEEKIMIFNIPGLVAGTGSDDYPYPFPVLVCSKCGEIESYYKKIIEKGKKYQEENKEAVKGTTLILSAFALVVIVDANFQLSIFK